MLLERGGFFLQKIPSTVNSTDIMAWTLYRLTGPHLVWGGAGATCDFPDGTDTTILMRAKFGQLVLTLRAEEKGETDDFSIKYRLVRTFQVYVSLLPCTWLNNLPFFWNANDQVTK